MKRIILLLIVIYLYANFKYPEKRVLKAVFSGRDLNQIKIGGNALKHPELRKQLDEEYSTTIKKYFGDTTIDELFRKYCIPVSYKRIYQMISMLIIKATHFTLLADKGSTLRI